MKSTSSASSLVHGVNYSPCGLGHDKKKQKATKQDTTINASGSESDEKYLSKLSNIPSTRRYPSKVVENPDCTYESWCGDKDYTANVDKANIITPMVVTEEEKATKSKEEPLWNTETAIRNFFLDYEGDNCDEYDKDDYPMHGLSVCISDDGTEVDVFNRIMQKQDKRN